jgi:LPXTG-site transpeptidase (sortase) family protein
VTCQFGFGNPKRRTLFTVFFISARPFEVRRSFYFLITFKKSNKICYTTLVKTLASSILLSGIMILCLVLLPPLSSSSEEGAKLFSLDVAPGSVGEVPPLVPIQESFFESMALTQKTVPVELVIESIGVNAPIEPVGLLDGGMAVPALPEYVGWYKFGAVPGERGSAVLAGHVNWRDSPDAVFTHLKDVSIGDHITVKHSNGEMITFSVFKITSYPLSADATEVFSSYDGLSYLNLITCGGTWNQEIGSHELRLVVSAIKIES